METKKLLRKLRDWVLWNKFFFNRGDNMMSDFVKLISVSALVGVFVDKINILFNTSFNSGKAMLFIPLLVVFQWIIGRLDFHFCHLIQKENEIQMFANPALYSKLTNINNSINEMKNGNKQKAEDNNLI